MDAVYRVVFHNFPHAGHNAFLHRFGRRVKVDFLIHDHHIAVFLLIPLFSNVIVAEFFDLILLAHPVRVEPGFDFQLIFVCRLAQQFQWVVF